MIGQEVYEQALANVSQQLGDNERWDDLALHWLNNSILVIWQISPGRLINEQEYIAEAKAPEVKSLDEEINMPAACKLPLIYELTAQLWEDAGESYKAQDYRGRSLDALRSAFYCVPERVIDVYG